MSGFARFTLIVLLAVTGSVWMAQDAQAKRLGGSRSFGMQRDSGAMRQAAPPPASPGAPTT